MHLSERLDIHNAKRAPVPSKRSKYIELSTQKSVSLLQHQIKSIQIDCCFRFSKTQWGHIDNTCAGVIYIDLTIHQPQDCRLASFSATVTLVPIDIINESGEATTMLSAAGTRTERDLTKSMPKPSPSGLEVTDYFGPKAIYGSSQEAAYSRKFVLQPSIGASGFTLGGMGFENNKDSTISTRWKFEGMKMGVTKKMASADAGNEITPETQNQPAKYQRVSWKLEENKQEAQIFRNPTLHTAFAFEHENKPFLLELEIEGKLRRRRELLLIRHRSHRASARAKIDAGKLSDGINQDLSLTARGLDNAMVEQNCRTQGIGELKPLRIV